MEITLTQLIPEAQEQEKKRPDNQISLIFIRIILKFINATAYHFGRHMPSCFYTKGLNNLLFVASLLIVNAVYANLF